MTTNWLTTLTVNSLPALLDWPDDALTYFVNRYLVGKQVEPIETLWNLQETTQLVSKQQDDGSWKYPGKVRVSDTSQNYSLSETFRNLRVLVEMYGFTRAHAAMQKAADYVFS